MMDIRSLNGRNLDHFRDLTKVMATENQRHNNQGVWQATYLQRAM